MSRHFARESVRLVHGRDHGKGVEQHTGDFIKRLRAGEPFVLTYRGKRIGVVTPCTDDQWQGSAAGADDRWAEVETALALSEPAFPDWSQATAWIRDRTSSTPTSS